MRGTFLDLASVHPDDLDLSRLKSTVDDWQLLDATDRGEVVSAIAGSEVVVTNKVVLDARCFEQSDRLKLVCVAATGFNNIDINAARQHGVTVCNVRGYATASVAQHVFMLLLSLVTSADRYRREVDSGEWSRSEFFCLLGHPVRELEGMVLGVVGYGELGRAVARIAECFGMKLLIARRDEQDQREGRIALHELLPQVDVLSLHCPLTADNHGLIGRREIALMKPDALLINTARGGLVDESALVAALRSGKLGGAGLDVLEKEPPPLDSPTLSSATRKSGLDNLIITPHTAWASRQSRQRLIDEIAENILAFNRGDARNVV